MPATLNQLRETRAKLASDLHALVATAGAESRMMTADEQAKFDAIDADLVSHDQTIERFARAEAVDLEQKSRLAQQQRQDWENQRRDLPTSKDQQMAFKAWSLGRRSPERFLRAAQKCGVNVHHNELTITLGADAQTRGSTGPLVSTTAGANQSTGNTGAGINPLQGLQSVLKYFGGMRDVCRIVRTDNGQSLPFPVWDDTAAVAVIVAQGAALDVNSEGIGQVPIETYQYSSKWFRVSLAMAQDAGFNLTAEVEKALGTRIARGTHNHFTVGSGSGQPWGVVPRCSVGLTPTSGVVDAAINTTNVLALPHAVDRLYRQNGKYMLHDSMLKKIKLLTDTQGRPLWLPGLASGEPDTLGGYGYIVNNDMTTVTTGAASKWMLFGDFSHHVLRDVNVMSLFRADELFLNTGEIGWVALSRHGSDTVAKTTSNWPIVAMVGS